MFSSQSFSTDSFSTESFLFDSWVVVAVKKKTTFDVGAWDLQGVERDDANVIDLIQCIIASGVLDE